MPEPSSHDGTRYLGRFVGGPRDGTDEMLAAQASGQPHLEWRFVAPLPVDWAAPISAPLTVHPPLDEVYRWRGKYQRRRWSFQQGHVEPEREWVYVEVVYEWVGYQ